MLLALDTSTSFASLALLADGRVLAHRAWAIGPRHSVEVFDALGDLLAAGGATTADIRAIGVATGPGSFNGVRVGVTTAKTLAFVWGAALVGVGTLAAIAQTQAGAAGGAPILALLGAGRGELYAGWYDYKERAGVVVACGPVAILAPADLAALAPAGPVLVAGEAPPDLLAPLVAALGRRARLAEPLAPPERALGVAALATARLAAGQADAPLTLEPAYVRRPNITPSARHIVAPPAPT